MLLVGAAHFAGAPFLASCWPGAVLFARENATLPLSPRECREAVRRIRRRLPGLRVSIPRRVNYVSYDGGGDLLTALLGKKIAAGTSGLGEYVDQIEASQVRVLAVSDV